MTYEPADAGSLRLDRPNDATESKPRFTYTPTTPFPPAPATETVTVFPPATSAPFGPEPPSVPATQSSRGGRGLFLTFLAALLGVAIGASTTVAVLHRTGAVGGVVKVPAPVPNGKANRLEGVAAVAAAVLPSVVKIDIEGQTAFGQQVAGTGSGVIYRTDGYIITNNHVVESATSVTVTLSTGEELTARVIGNAAPADDIAVIKVERTGLPAATIGSVQDLTVGETAVAIGSPFGFQSTVTAGVVSATHLNFNLTEGERFTDAIQTDAPINPGNSGGALANARGEVIGINTAIIGGNGGNVGIGFAIPIDIARSDADQIIKTGHAVRPFLGVTPKTIPNVNGARLDEVVTGGPADKAGLRVGDRIVKINGEDISSAEDMIATLNRFPVGTSIKITYVRAGSSHDTTATLAARPTG